MQHRTRNLLTVVQAIAARTFAEDGARRSFSTRLEALGRVQTLVSNAASNDGIDLADIIHLELQAHGADQSDNVTVSGPSTLLDAERVQTLALVLHELATNAVKYGALSGTEGQLEITWTVTDHGKHEPFITLEWRESGVTMPSDTAWRGYGSKLIEKALSVTLRAKTKLEFGVDGVFCRIEMPLDLIKAGRRGTLH